MKFSIITTCKNSEKTIENTINSVISQNYKEVEYIIVDGASTDRSLDIVEKYKSKIDKVISEPDEGIYDAMNKGIEASTGNFLIFLNSDDRLLHDNILSLVAQKINVSQKELYYGDLLTLDKISGKISLRKYNKLNKIYLIKNTPCQPTTFYRRDVFEKYGNFDINYKIVSDHEWFLRVFLKHKISSEYVGFPINIFNIGGISTSSSREEKISEERKKMFESYFPPIEWKIYNCIAKNFRALTTLPVSKDIMNLLFKTGL